MTCLVQLEGHWRQHTCYKVAHHWLHARARAHSQLNRVSWLVLTRALWLSQSRTVQSAEADRNVDALKRLQHNEYTAVKWPR
jgi:hypothetical protein